MKNIKFGKGKMHISHAEAAIVGMDLPEEYELEPSSKTSATIWTDCLRNMFVV